jgi:hypothetical protein
VTPPGVMTADPPAVTIRVELERDAPVLTYDFANVGERLRFLDWLEQRPALAILIARAIDLSEEEART